MALQRILVVDDSPAVRETLGILLGGEYDVDAVGVSELLDQGIGARAPHLVIASRPKRLAGYAAALPPEVPVLWLDAHLGGLGAVGGQAPGEPPRQFSPRLLRERVAALLAPAPPTPRGGRARLLPPFVPAAVARVVADALATPLPLHLIGEPGVGKRILARAIHDAAGGRAFVPVAGIAFAAEAADAAEGGTLFIDRVDQLSAASQQTLLAALDPTSHGHLGAGARLRVITTAAADIGAAVDDGRFAPDLFYLLTVFTARLPPLRERPQDLPALADALAGEIAAALGRGPISFTERARTRLCHYLWFGNLAELEAVLARSVARTRNSLLDADDLVFAAQPPQARPLVAASAGARTESGDELGARSLDLIINELAHEFKNPLVTIKTFAHHLRRSLPDGADDAQVARLTGEAVAQIDQTLENLLEFTRLEAPAPQVVPLSSVLDPVLDECARALGARGIRLEHQAVPGVGVSGDPQQLTYALTNLIRSVTRGLAATQCVSVGFAPPATITVQLPDGAEPFGNHLATLLEDPAAGVPAIPLGVAIANAVLARNGAHVALGERTPFAIDVRFRLAEVEAPLGTPNGSNPRTGR